MKKKYNQEDYDNVANLYVEGRTAAQIGALTGISIPYVKTIVKKSGIEMRPSGFRLGNSHNVGKPCSTITKTKIGNSNRGDPIEQYINLYKNNANKRNHVFELSRDQFEFFIYATCAYCGIAPTERHLNGNSFVVNGIDRIDNAIGYVIENCCACCKRCNRMKSAMSNVEFILHCIEVAKCHDP